MRAVSLLVMAATIAACSSPTYDFAPWTMAPGEHAPVYEYGPVSAAERNAHRIELVEDLVIAPSRTAAASFFSVGTIAVAADGSIYVVDSGNKRVQVFDQGGEYLRTLGHEGQGPGELMLPAAVAIVGDRVVVNDLLNHRLTIWNLDGDYLADVVPRGGRLMAEFLHPVAADAFAAVSRSASAEGPLNLIASYGLDGAERVRFAEVPFVEPVVLGGQVGVGMIMPHPDLATDAGGGVYVADGIEYQVHAYQSDGTPRWSARVAEQRATLPRALTDRIVELARRRYPDLDAAGTEWPELLPAIDDLATDGQDRLYVFPFDWRSESFGFFGLLDDEADERPVDVYARDGERIFTGTMPIRRWLAARGEHVYAIGRDVNDEETVVRYRVVFP